MGTIQNLGGGGVFCSILKRQFFLMLSWIEGSCRKNFSLCLHTASQTTPISKGIFYKCTYLGWHNSLTHISQIQIIKTSLIWAQWRDVVNTVSRTFLCCHSKAIKCIEILKRFQQLLCYRVLSDSCLILTEVGHTGRERCNHWKMKHLYRYQTGVFVKHWLVVKKWQH